MNSRYPFIAPCPIHNCSRNNEKFQFQWFHSDCGGKFYINTEAEFECENGHRVNMRDLNFKCENHDCEKSSSQGLLLSICFIAKTQNLDYDTIKKMNNKLMDQK